ncbi:MAG TPA: hypothetical protein VGQ65_24000 [Thermoanaerobaculia bacterium]|jgi:hypothetical protein|nr:hypothetical protein [Thermoanaerobaculia bacterium]
MMYLLVAHPGHELLLHGWISRNTPVVHVLTDGTAHSSSSATRLGDTADLLRDLGARRGAIFGRLSDREAYAMILERNTALVRSLVVELAAELERDRPSILVCDAAEGYNPVHDLCRLIGGAAIAMAGVPVKQYEYAVVNDPHSRDAAAIVVELSAAEHAAKMDRAAAQSASLADIEAMVTRYGANAYQRETLSPVADWTAIDDGEPPLYERYGEERVAAGQYMTVIRRREHMLPLRDALRAAVEKRSCAF